MGLKALQPYLDDMVIAGGWVPYLYAAHERPAAEAITLKTRDLDVAVARHVPERGRSIDHLLEEAGFTCEFRSLENPPVTAYVATHAGDEIEIEFITSAKGSSKGVRSVQSGLTAQELHYVDLLLANKWFLLLDVLSDGELHGRVWVPTPAAFTFHKGLVYKKRTDRLKSEKDLYYIFYVLDGFRAWHEWMRAEMPELAAASPTWFRRCLRDLAASFATPASPGVDALAHQRPPTAYPGMDDDQFRQYAWSAMRDLLDMMRDSTSSRALR